MQNTNSFVFFPFFSVASAVDIILYLNSLSVRVGSEHGFVMAANSPQVLALCWHFLNCRDEVQGRWIFMLKGIFDTVMF